MKLTEYNEPFVACPYRLKLHCDKEHAAILGIKPTLGDVNICEYVSNQLTKPFIVNPIFCNITCNKFGPCGGKEIDTTKEEVFVAKCFNYKFNVIGVGAIDSYIIRKVLKAYQSHMDIRVPPEWSIIKNELEPLYQFPFLKSIKITGSLLSKRTEHKDYDIVLCVDNFKEAHTNKDFISKLPTTINDVFCDYYVTTADETVLFFITMDCDKRILYTTKWFDLKLKSIEDGVVVKDCGTKGMSGTMVKELERFICKGTEDNLVPGPVWNFTRDNIIL